MIQKEDHTTYTARTWSVGSDALELTDDDFCLWHTTMSEAGLFAPLCQNDSSECDQAQLNGMKIRDLRNIKLTDYCCYGDLIDFVDSRLWYFVRDDVDKVRNILVQLRENYRQKTLFGQKAGGIGVRKIDKIHTSYLMAGIEYSENARSLLVGLVESLEPNTEEELMLACTAVNSYYWLAVEGGNMSTEPLDGSGELNFAMLTKLISNEEEQKKPSASVYRYQNLFLKSLNQLNQRKSARKKIEKKTQRRRVP